MRYATHKRSLETALEELARLMEERQEMEIVQWKLDERINHLTTTIEGLSELIDVKPEKEYPFLFPEKVSPDVGLMNAVSNVLRTSREPMLPLHVLMALQRNGSKLNGYKNVLICIEEILKRLKESGEVKTLSCYEVLAYEWINEEKVARDRKAKEVEGYALSLIRGEKSPDYQQK